MLGRPTIDVNAIDHSGYTALFIVAMAGRADAVSVMLAAGADHTIATKRGKTILYGAVEKGKLAVIEALLPYTTVYQLRQQTKFGTDVLHVAKKSGKREVIGESPARCPTAVHVRPQRPSALLQGAAASAGRAPTGSPRNASHRHDARPAGGV